MPRRVLLVLPTTTYRAAAYLRAARRLGLSVVVASEAPSSLASLRPDGELVIDLGDPEGAARRAQRLARRAPIDAVVGVDEGAVLAAAVIAARLGLRHSPPDAVSATRDKRALRRRLAAAGVAQPDFTTWPEPVGDPAGAAARVGFPCVVKPVDQAGSRGVIRADGPRGLLRATRTVLAMLEADRAAGRCGPLPDPPLLLERFVEGPEVALEGLVVGGRLRTLAIFDKPDPLDGPTFEETLYCTPSRLPAAAQRRVRAAAGAAVRALGLTEGPVHAELRLPGGRALVLEVAARTIGGQCSEVLRLADGGSLEMLVLRHALGERPLGTRLAPGAAGVLMLPIPRAGVVTGVEGLEQARAVPGVDDVRLAVPVGQPVRPLPEGDRYLGFAFAHAPDVEAVEVALRVVRRLVRVRISPQVGPARRPARARPAR
ncbi:MAG TPA: ATP-grasp domain-containing protein [Candidatus Micrarchaeia archaeon]|nr:ATP-grasp domain-containing protein [Candidatus Micrarchaeia archaeon]